MKSSRGKIIYRCRSQDGPVEVAQDRDTRTLYFGNDTRQSSMYLFHPAVLVLAYTRYMMSSLLFHPRPRRVLMLGLGGGSLVRFLMHYFPTCCIDVVEARPEVVHVARNFFELPDEDRLNVHTGDGVEFIQSGAADFADYDIILSDAFDATGMIPGVVAGDFLAAARGRLKEGGVFCANLSRNQEELYRAGLRTLRKGFPRTVLRLPVFQKGNEVVLAFRGTIPRTATGTLEHAARELADLTGLEFTEFLRVLRRDNQILLQATPA